MITFYIYAIRCDQNGKEYIGCTRNPAKRAREHRCLLLKGKHACKSLQSDWDKYGALAFKMEPLETLPGKTSVDVKREREIWWMKDRERQGILYNENLSSFQGPPGSIEKAVAAAHLKPGNRWTPEANEKRRLAQLGKPKGHGAKISATKQAKRAMR